MKRTKKALLLAAMLVGIITMANIVPAKTNTSKHIYFRGIKNQFSYPRKNVYRLIYTGLFPTGVKNSNNRVASLGYDEESDYITLKLKKPGTTTVQFTSHSEVATSSNKYIIYVINYKNPFKTLKIGSVNYASKFARTDECCLNIGPVTGAKIKIALRKGWKLQKIYKSYTGKNKIKNNGTVNLMPNDNIYIDIKNKKYGVVYTFWIDIRKGKNTGGSSSSVTSTGTPVGTPAGTPAGQTGTSTVTSTVNPSVSFSCNVSGSSSAKLAASTVPAGLPVSWSSSDNNTVSVTSDGRITAKRAGTARITASIWYNGRNYQSSKNVTVYARKSYGAWSDWTTDPVSSSSTQEVRTAKVFRYYCFLCPVCGGREPFQGISDCHQYSLTLANGMVKWSTIPFSNCNPQGYSYTTAKKWTQSLGDGLRWNLSTADIGHTEYGYQGDAGCSIICTGYSRRSVSTTYVFG